jgi:hypothetical protein
MSLHCLIYTSVATQKMTDDYLKSILEKSRPKNIALSVTGMLLYLDPFFVQVLEGEKNVITDIFKKISQDPLHHKVSLILKKPINERSFSHWAMGFNKIDEAHIDSVVSLDEFYKSESFNRHPKDIVELFDMFKNETLF